MEPIRPRNAAKEYLRRYRMLVIRKASLEREIIALRDSLTGITAPIKDAIQGSGGDRMADTVARIADAENRLPAVVGEIREQLNSILTAIEAVPDETQRTVLTLRYVEGLDWISIQEHMHYERTQIFVIHGRALVTVNKWLEGQGRKENDL